LGHLSPLVTWSCSIPPDWADCRILAPTDLVGD